MTTGPQPIDLFGDDAMQLGHSINMVADLPTALAGPLPDPIRHACIDAFLVHASLVAGVILDHHDQESFLTITERDHLRWLRQFTIDQVTSYDGRPNLDQPMGAHRRLDRRTYPKVVVDDAEIRTLILDRLDLVVRGHKELGLWLNEAQERIAAGTTMDSGRDLIVEIYGDDQGEHRWRIRHTINGEIMGSGEGYADRRDRDHAVALLFPGVTVVGVDGVDG